ncbi:MAG: phage tail tape measure protein, partial [Panacagrimonas sp.]
MTTQTVTLRLVAENGAFVGNVRASKAGLDALGGGADQTRGQMKRLGEQSDQTSKQLVSARNIAKDLARGFATGLGISGFVGTLAGAIGISREYGKSLAEVSTLLDDTSNMAAYASQARLMAREFGTAATEQSAALYQIFSAGQAGAKGIAVLDAANRLAIGGVTDIRTAADGLTSVLNAYGDRVASAADVSDTLFVGMRQGKTTIGELSGSLGLIAPIAASLDVEFSDLVASISAVTLGGVKTAEAVTQVRGVLAGILKPSSEAAELASKLGLEFNAQALAAKGLSGFLADVQDKTGGNKELMSQLFGSVEALGAVFALTANGGATFNSVLEAMESRAGQTEVAFGKMSAGADFALNRMKSAAADSLITLGNKLLTVIAPAALVFADNIEAITGAIATGSTIAAAYFALFVAAPAIYTAVTVAGWAFAAMLTATNVGLVASITNMGLLKSAGLVLFAAFAGWQIGTYLRDNFLEAQLAGIAFVEGTLVGWERIKQGAGIAWAGVQAAAIGALNIVRERLADLVAFVADITEQADIFGFGASAAANLRQLESAIRPTASAADQFSASVASINSEAETNIARVRGITSDMADYAIETFSAREAAAATADALSAVTSGAEAAAAAVVELTAAEKEAEKAKKALEKARRDANASATEEVAQLRQVNDLIRDGIDAQLAELRVRHAAKGIDPETTRQLEEQQARNELLIKGQREAAQIGAQAAQQTADAWKDRAANIRESLTDAIYRGFEAGKGAARNFFDTLKNTAQALVLRPIIEFAVAPIANIVSSILGGGSGSGGGGFSLTGLKDGFNLFKSAFSNPAEKLFTSVVKLTDAAATAFPSLNTAASSIQRFALNAGPAINALAAAAAANIAGSVAGDFIASRSSRFSQNTGTYAGAGAAAGAVVGSVVPVIGTAIGAAVGGAIGTLVGGIEGRWKLRVRDLS